MRAWTKINYRIWESCMTLALPQLSQQLCFCSWGGSNREMQCQLKATYLSLASHQSNLLLITEAFCVKQTGTLAGKLLTIIKKKKKKLKTPTPNQKGRVKKTRKIFFSCIMRMGLGTGSPHLPAPDPLSSASSGSSNSLSHAFSWQFRVVLGLLMS